MFRNEFWFLSNMSPSPMKIGGVRYTCAEAAFQACKLEDKSKRVMFENLSGMEARRLGRSVRLRKDWNQVRVDAMRWIINIKFKNPELAEKLVATGDTPLVEENAWNDKFWGVCNGKGENWLGRILMEKRAELRKESGK